MKWIKCSEELPPFDKHVLLFSRDTHNRGIFVGYRHIDGFSFQCYPIGSYASDGLVLNIICWRDLPEPPKDQE